MHKIIFTAAFIMSATSLSAMDQDSLDEKWEEFINEYADLATSEDLENIENLVNQLQDSNDGLKSCEPVNEPSDNADLAILDSWIEERRLEKASLCAQVPQESSKPDVSKPSAPSARGHWLFVNRGGIAPHFMSVPHGRGQRGMPMRGRGRGMPGMRGRGQAAPTIHKTPQQQLAEIAEKFSILGEIGERDVQIKAVTLTEKSMRIFIDTLKQVKTLETFRAKIINVNAYHVSMFAELFFVDDVKLRILEIDNISEEALILLAFQIKNKKEKEREKELNKYLLEEVRIDSPRIAANTNGVLIAKTILKDELNSFCVYLNGQKITAPTKTRVRG